MTVKITVKYEDKSQKVTDKMIAKFAKIMNEMEADANRFVPVDTGLLRSTIVLEKKTKTHYMLPARTPYAAAQEFGTRHQRGTPYMRPALAIAKNKIKKLIE